MAPKRKAESKAKRARVKGEEASRAKFPRHSVAKALRIAKAILEQNAGKACTPAQAAKFVGVGHGGPFNVEIGSAIKYGFLERPQTGQIQPTALAKKIIRPHSPNDELEGYREAILKAPEIAEVYKHYRGENLPDDQFLKNTVVETYKIPAESFLEFKQVFVESLETAQLLTKHGDKLRVVDVFADDVVSSAPSERIKKLGKAANVGANDSCFVMQPFVAPLGDYYEKVYNLRSKRLDLRP